MLYLDSQFNEVAQIFLDLIKVFSVGEADQLGIAISMILIAKQTEALKVCSIHP